MSKKNKSEEEQALRAEIKTLRETLAGQQMELRDAGLPVIVLVEGWAAAGKGSLIGELPPPWDRRRTIGFPSSGPMPRRSRKTGSSCSTIPGGWNVRCAGISEGRSPVNSIGNMSAAQRNSSVSSGTEGISC